MRITKDELGRKFKTEEDWDKFFERLVIGIMDFSEALELLKKGCRMMRSGWNGKDMWIELQRPDENSKMTLPYIFIEYPAGHPAYPNGSRVPWLASQTDILASDWSLHPTSVIPA